MTSRLVPTACFMGSPPKSTSAGTMRKPPPTPQAGEQPHRRGSTAT